jgi:catechol 2,3-dioxygenase
MTHSPTPGALPGGARIGRIALRVADLDAVIDFYRDVVGLAVLDRTATGATLGADGTPLLVLAREADAPERARAAAGLYHAAFRVPSRGALGDALARVRGQWELDGASDHLVSEALYLSDPEGNGVELYRDRPRESWPETGDGGVAMATDPLDLEGVAAAAAGDDRAPPGTDVGHVHLEVASLDAFEAFYVDALGFAVRATVPGARFVAAGGYHHHVAGNTWNHRTAPAEGRGLSWVEVVVPTAEGLAAVRERLVDRGHAVTATNEGVAVADPDGIEIRLRVGAADR